MFARWLSGLGLFAAGVASAGPEDCRAYAIGDVHGRLDLLVPLLERIEEDNRERVQARAFVIFLGDLIDRGPNSAEVVEYLRNYAPDGMEPIFLAGNHEEVLLQVVAGDGPLLRQWLRFGGSECLASYGLDASLLEAMSDEEGIARVRSVLPESHVAFLESFADTFRFGDYLFVHGGIRPGISVEEQSQRDLRWIREPFLSDRRDHGFVVVHGHTISTEVVERPNRICIDTGAYRTGLLTAIGIEGEERWIMQHSGVGSDQQ